MIIVINRKTATISTVVLIMMIIALVMVSGTAADHGPPPYNNMGMPLDFPLPDGPDPFGCLILNADDTPDWSIIEGDKPEIKVKFDNDGLVSELECKEKGFDNDVGSKIIYTRNDNPFGFEICYFRGEDPKTGMKSGFPTFDWEQSVSPNGQVKLTCKREF